MTKKVRQNILIATAASVEIIGGMAFVERAGKAASAFDCSKNAAKMLSCFIVVLPKKICALIFRTRHRGKLAALYFRAKLISRTHFQPHGAIRDQSRTRDRQFCFLIETGVRLSLVML